MTEVALVGPDEERGGVGEVWRGWRRLLKRRRCRMAAELGGINEGKGKVGGRWEFLGEVCWWWKRVDPVVEWSEEVGHGVVDQIRRWKS